MTAMVASRAHTTHRGCDRCGCEPTHMVMETRRLWLGLEPHITFDRSHICTHVAYFNTFVSLVWRCLLASASSIQSPVAVLQMRPSPQNDVDVFVALDWTSLLQTEFI